MLENIVILELVMLNNQRLEFVKIGYILSKIAENRGKFKSSVLATF